MGQEKVEFPLGGKVIGVSVKQGDKVEDGDTLCLLEAMKMENPIVAPVAGIVVSIGLSAGQVVKKGELAAIIEY